jgi:hypothetical protein
MPLFKARLRKQRSETIVTEHGNETIHIYLGEIPAGGSIHYAYEVQAQTYTEAKARINALAYHDHRVRPLWAK